MKVLIAVDGSVCSFEAIHLACRILSPSKDSIVLFYAPPNVPLGPEVNIEAVEQGQTALANSILHESLAQVPDFLRPKVQTISSIGETSSEILTAADEHKADLIVVGARGLGPLARFILGSVSRKVVHTGKLPILVVRKPTEVRSSTGLSVLLACESVSMGSALASVLNQFTWPENSRCTPVHVVPSILGGAIPDWLKAQTQSPDVEPLIQAWVDEQNRQWDTARQELVNLSDNLPATLNCIPPMVVEGNAGSEIVKAANDQLADLIVVGAKHSTALGRMFIGSTCEYVLNHAPCSVLVVHDVQ